MHISNKFITRIINESIDNVLAYHGSNADFDDFDLAFVNTGSKAQDYGYGIYLFLADNNVGTYGKNKYTVEIPAKKTLYLYADKVLSPKFINNAIYKIYKYILETQPEAYPDKTSKMDLIYDLKISFEGCDGLSLYGTLESYLGSDKEVSQFIYKYLKKIGLKYMINDEYPCVVMFNPKDIKIIKKENS